MDPIEKLDLSGVSESLLDREVLKNLLPWLSSIGANVSKTKLVNELMAVGSLLLLLIGLLPPIEAACPDDDALEADVE